MNVEIIYIILLIVIMVIVGIAIFSHPSISSKLTIRQIVVIKWIKWSVIPLAVFSQIGLFINMARQPTITLNSNMIHISGIYGGKFNVSDVQSIDTINVIPRVGTMRGGSGFAGIFKGNFDLANEEKTAKLCLDLKRPPFIKIRMNDDRLLLINFKERDKTVNFYEQLRNVIKTN